MIYANMLGGMGGLYPTSPQSHKNVMIAGKLGISPIMKQSADEKHVLPRFDN